MPTLANVQLCVNCLEAPAESDRGECRCCAAARRIPALARNAARHGGRDAILTETALDAILQTGVDAGPRGYPSAQARFVKAALEYAVERVEGDHDPRAALIERLIDLLAIADRRFAEELGWAINAAEDAENLRRARIHATPRNPRDLPRAMRGEIRD